MSSYDITEQFSTSDSDSEYLVDTRYHHKKLKYRKKTLTKTIKLIHGRCVVVYRGSSDLLSIAAKDADQNCYCDFVFVCHDRKPTKLIKNMSSMSRSRSAMHDSSISDDEDHTKSTPKTSQNRFISRTMNSHLPKQRSVLPSRMTQNNHDDYDLSIPIRKTFSIQSNCQTQDFDSIVIKNLNEQLMTTALDSDSSTSVDDNESSASLPCFPWSSMKPI